MTTLARTATSSLDHSFARFLRMAITGSIGAAILNLLTWWIAEGFNNVSLLVQPPGETAPIGMNIVILLMAGIVPAIGAALLYWILDSVTNSPRMWFIILSIIVLVVMYFPAASLPISAESIMWLQIMHVTTAVGIIWAVVYVSGWFPARNRL